MFARRLFSPMRIGLTLAAAFGAAVIAVGPVAAQTEVGHTGVVGFHTLRDNSKRAGARCTWTERDGSYFWEGDLTHIDVRPPRMRAVSGTQEVGWRFTVQRQAWYASPGLWKNTYTSPIQWRMTDTSHDAAFAWMGVSVNVPTSNPDKQPHYLYRVRVRMLWRNGAGDVTGTAVHEVDWYRKVEMGTYNEDYECNGWYAWEI